MKKLLLLVTLTTTLAATSAEAMPLEPEHLFNLLEGVLQTDTAGFHKKCLGWRGIRLVQGDSLLTCSVLGDLIQMKRSGGQTVTASYTKRLDRSDSEWLDVLVGEIGKPTSDESTDKRIIMHWDISGDDGAKRLTVTNKGQTFIVSMNRTVKKAKAAGKPK
jgi:hypothetical protein